jgi:hypothetical protein
MFCLARRRLRLATSRLAAAGTPGARASAETDAWP